MVRNGAANALVHYWTAIPPHCFAIEFRYFVQNHLISQPSQAAHLMVNAIVSKLHNEEGHFILEEELQDRSKSPRSPTKEPQIPAAIPQPHVDAAVPSLPAYNPRVVKNDILPLDISSVPDLKHHTNSIKDSLEIDEKTSDATWKKQYQPNLLRLRAITKGNVPKDYHSQYLDMVKILLPSIMKCVNSPRTVLSSLGCTLVQEMVATLKSDMDPHVDYILSETINLCGSTRKIVSEDGSATVDVIFAYVSYSSRLLKHISHACESKNIQTRVCAARWLKTIILHYRLKIEQAHDLDFVIKYITKGLSDASPTVREETRSTFWIFARVWPQHATTMFQGAGGKTQAILMIDSKSFSLLDETNPTSTERPEMHRGTTDSSRPRSFRDTIRAAKKAATSDTTTKSKPRPTETQVAGRSTIRPASAMSSNKPLAMTSRTQRPLIPRPDSAMSAPKGKGKSKAAEVADTPVWPLRSAPVRFRSYGVKNVIHLPDDTVIDCTTTPANEDASGPHDTVVETNTTPADDDVSDSHDIVIETNTTIDDNARGLHDIVVESNTTPTDDNTGGLHNIVVETNTIPIENNAGGLHNIVIDTNTTPVDDDVSGSHDIIVETNPTSTDNNAGGLYNTVNQSTTTSADDNAGGLHDTVVKSTTTPADDETSAPLSPLTMQQHDFQRLFGIIRELGGFQDRLPIDTHGLNPLIVAVLSCLVSPARTFDSPASHAAWNEDTQYLLNLVTEMDKSAPGFVDPVTVLCSLIHLRGKIHQRDSIVYSLEELSHRLLPKIDPYTALEFTVQTVNSELVTTEPHHGAIMGFFILGGLLDRLSLRLDEELGKELADLAHRALRDRSPTYEDGESAIGRSTIAYIRSLFHHFNDLEGFYRAVCKGSMAHQEVLDYYLA